MRVGNQTKVRVKEWVIETCLFLCAFLSVLTTIAIIFVLVSEAVFGFSGKAFFREVPVTDFLFGTRWSPDVVPREFGVLPLLTGTLWVTGIAACIGLPIGVLTAVYLSEYASPRVRTITCHSSSHAVHRHQSRPRRGDLLCGE